MGNKLISVVSGIGLGLFIYYAPAFYKLNTVLIIGAIVYL